ncbi:uncharacterized protein LOC128550817 [Mercenaria mercenaria]|uniref:uncharacterized protein LOC128550817 n=1 Tax=Mercenaria mercenaria TaxID=6596 RepID=UPI00234EF85A|nr:uncharacterized protein LOC128550817 [Mercenaria mercenaria]
MQTILKSSFLDKFSETEKPKILPENANLLGITGDTAPFKGKTKIKLEIGSQTFEIWVLLAEIRNDFILGRDFILSQNCDLLFSKHMINLNGERLYCYSTEREVHMCRIAITDDIEVPPDTEMIITGRTIDPYPKDKPGVVEASQNFMENHDILVARALVEPKLGLIPIRIANLENTPIRLYKNTIIATLEGTELPEIIPTNLAETPSTSKSTNKSSQEIPDHLKECYERSTKDLTEEEKKEVKDLLCEFQDIFSKSDDDIGHTDLVEYTIDTGDNKPVRTPPYRIPLAKREMAEKEKKKTS